MLRSVVALVGEHSPDGGGGLDGRCGDSGQVFPIRGGSARIDLAKDAQADHRARLRRKQRD